MKKTLEDKAGHLAQIIAEAVAGAGLIFVDGSDTTATIAPQPDPGVTNGQKRMGFYFAVSGKDIK